MKLTTEEKVLIARFMNWEQNNAGTWFRPDHSKHFDINHSRYGFTADRLPFDDNWNELMRVVEHINRHTVYTCNILALECKIFMHPAARGFEANPKSFSCMTYDNSFDNTLRAVTDYIKSHYNESYIPLPLADISVLA